MLLFLSANNALWAQDAQKALRVEALRAAPQRQAPVVEVTMDRPDLVYELGSEAHATVKTQVEGFLYLLYVHSDGNVYVLLPNEFQAPIHVTTGGAYTIPDKGDAAQFRITASEPLGTGLVKAIVLDKPCESINIKALAKGQVLLELDESRLNDLALELTGKGVGTRPGANQPVSNFSSVDSSRILGDHQIRIETVSVQQFKKGNAARRGKRRFVVAVGVGKQKHAEQFTPHAACENDARQFAQTMKGQYGTDSVLLLNEDVTAINVHKTLLDVARQSQPGDEVILFWSGHGTICPDISGDETDRTDEVLVTYDGDPDDVEGTMILDDMLGRWVQDFVGCEMLVIIDACFAGGQARNEKSISWEGEFNRFTKDITEQQATVLCASSRGQLAHVKTEKDLSVMTHFLLEYLERHQNTKVTIDRLFEHLKTTVPEYTKQADGIRVAQEPVLIGNTKSRIVFGD
ncbi:MAG: caspase family protein [Planctomycetaceae bacterium]|nr:caspase family protein [Planctomycetaceae bacterium]